MKVGSVRGHLGLKLGENLRFFRVANVFLGRSSWMSTKLGIRFQLNKTKAKYKSGVSLGSFRVKNLEKNHDFVMSATFFFEVFVLFSPNLVYSFL